MSYLIQQMWLCLLLAALLGAVIGWWFAKTSNQRKLNELDTNWQHKLEQKEAALSQRIDQLSQHAATTATIAEPLLTDQSSYDVEEVEGIGPSYGKKLRDMGISTTEQLLGQCYNLDGRINVAEHVGIEDFVVRKWGSMCDLMRLSGVEGQYSELMVYAGIDSVQDLGKQSASALHGKLSTSNENQNRVKSIPDESSIDLMITQAKSLKAIMQDV
jgi:hypothetical protein